MHDLATFLLPCAALLSWVWAGAPLPPEREAGIDLETVSAGAAAGSAEEALDPFLLTNLFSSRIVVEVDWVSGFEPSPKALRAIAGVLEKHCEPDKRIEIVPDDEIPAAVWERAAGRPGLESLVARYLDGDPADWEHAETLYVLYAPDSRPWYGKSVPGMADRITFARAGTVATVRTVLLFTGAIRREARLWITPAKVERAVLVHELGHVLGLVANPVHVQDEHPRHCSVARCVMHQPGARAQWINGLPALVTGRIPSRFGKRCAEDIAAAQRLWRERAAASPEFERRLRAARLLREASVAAAWSAGARPR